jgi:hydrogenase/urease accessory protein HupE
VLALFVNVLGMMQSVFRYLTLPLMLVGLWLALRKDRRMTWLLLATILYYLVVGSSLHMEIRYGLPMQSLLLVFAGFAVCRLGEIVYDAAFKRQRARGTDQERAKEGS